MVLVRGKTPEINMEAKGRKQTHPKKQTDRTKWHVPGFELRRGRKKKEKKKPSNFPIIAKISHQRRPSVEKSEAPKGY